jgi:hypothetical protein
MFTGSPRRPSVAQVEVALRGLQSAGTKKRAAVAVGKVALGVGIALFSGSYGTLAAGLKEAAGAGLDVVRQRLTRECLEQLLQLSWPPPDDEELKLLHDMHFHRSSSRSPWEVTGGRWEPKACFSVMLAKLAMAPQVNAALLRRLCLGDDAFVGLRGLVMLGLAPGGDKQPASRSEPMTRVACWASGVLSSLTDDSANPPTNEGLVRGPKRGTQPILPPSRFRWSP